MSLNYLGTYVLGLPTWQPGCRVPDPCLGLSSGTLVSGPVIDKSPCLPSPSRPGPYPGGTRAPTSASNSTYLSNSNDTSIYSRTNKPSRHTVSSCLLFCNTTGQHGLRINVYCLHQAALSPRRLCGSASGKSHRARSRTMALDSYPFNHEPL